MSASRWKTPTIEHPGRISPAGLRWVRGMLRPLVRALHRPTLAGLENLPAEGPFLLVSNHSAGIALSEIGSFIALWIERAGPERALAGFAHPLGLKIYPASVLMRHMGAVPSTYEGAADALSRGVPLLVFPGGDHESFRPIWDAHRVDFGGRRGFLRIARDAGVPIVPLGIRGSHFTVPILWRSRHVLPNALLLPRLLGMKRWPLTLFGAAGAAALLLGPTWSLPARALAAWAWLVSPLTCLPIVPATIRFRIGPALSPAELFGEASGEPTDDLTAALAKVEAAVQAQVDASR